MLNTGEYLKSSALGGMCSAACYCRKGRDGKPADLQCAHVDCPEFFGGGHDQNDNCVKQYDRNHCCSIKTVCGNFCSIKIQSRIFYKFPRYLNQMTKLTSWRHASSKTSRIVKVKKCIRRSIATSATARKTSTARLRSRRIKIATRSTAESRCATPAA